MSGSGGQEASDCDRVVSALSQTKKGQLKYDTKWKEEGRTEEIVNTVEEGLFSINFRPMKNGVNGGRSYVNGFGGNAVEQQSMSPECKNSNDSHQQLNSTVKPELQNDTSDNIGQSSEAAADIRLAYPPSSPSTLEKDENEELIKQYELERNEKVQESVEKTIALLRANYDALLEKMDSEIKLINNNVILLKLQNQKAYEEYANQIQSVMMQEQNLMGGGDSGRATTGEPTTSSSKLKELQERQKLLERQKELRLQQQTEYRLMVTRSKEAINRILVDCEARLQAEQQLHPQLQTMDASVMEQLQYYRTLLLGFISELAVILLTTTASNSSSSSQSQQSGGQPELTAEQVKLASEKEQQATIVGQRYHALLTQQVTKLQVESVLKAGNKRSSQQPQPPQQPTQPSTVIQSTPEAGKAQSTSSTTASSSAQPQFPPSTASSAASTQQPSTTSSTSNSVEKEFSHPAELIYQRSQLDLLRFEQIVDGFVAAKENKERRKYLQLAICTRINTMCNEEVSKLEEKTKKLLDLLSGKQVEVTGSINGMVKCMPADGSLHFAINKAVMTFLNVAIKQKHMALRLAPVISVLWSRLDPLFGQVFLAQLYRICPYALPYYPEQEEGQSAEEFLVMCGYQLNAQSGAISETGEAFQERIYPLVQLYGAVLQCNISEANVGRGGKVIQHPRDLQYAWHWLARVLSQRPQAVMTALMLDAFLAVTAHKLLFAYGRQFEKLVRHIGRTYVPQMQAVTQKGELQTLMKFKSLLEGIEHKMARRGSSRQQIGLSLLPQDMELVPDQFFRL